MRITRSLAFVVRQMTNTIARKTAVVSFGFIVLAGAVLTGQNLLTTPNTAHAITPPDSCFAFDAGTGTITDYYDYENNNSANPTCPKNVDIPSTIGGVAVTIIGDSAFYYKQLMSVTIPNSVTAIQNYGFDFNQLRSIVIPNSVTSIGSHAFYINRLSSVTVPSSVTSIGDYAFAHNFITTATFDGPVTTFGADIFVDNAVDSIIYGGITYTPTTPISEQCFAFSTGSITNYLYADMSLIKNNNVGCLSRDVDIPSTIGGSAVTSIGIGAFGDHQLTSVSIPPSVATIGNGAFSTNKITSVIIPDSVTTIGNLAFHDNRITAVTLPSGGATTIGSSSFSSNLLTSLTVPANITSIAGSAFQDNNIATVNFLGSVTTFGADIFIDNPIDSLTYGGTTHTPTLPIPEQCYTFFSGSINNYLYADMNLVKNSSIACLSRSVDIPSTIGGSAVTIIGTSAFYNNGLTSVVVPPGVVTIRSGAFRNNQLTSATLPNGVTSIGNTAFNGNKLTSITLPDTLTSIGSETFATNQLVSVTVPNSVTTIGSGAFSVQNTWGGDVDRSQQIDVPYFWSYDSVEVQEVYDNIWYVRLYTADPANPNSIIDDLISEDWWWYEDANNNGTTKDSLGGHIVNPALADINYITATGDVLQAPIKVTGITSVDVALDSYSAQAGGPFAPRDPYDIRPEEQAAMDAGFGQYYRLNDSFTAVAPTISGYVLFSPLSPYITQLTQADTAINFIYSTEGADPVDDAVVSPTDPALPDNASPALPGVPNTGLKLAKTMGTGVVIALGLITLGLMGFIGLNERSSRR